MLIIISRIMSVLFVIVIIAFFVLCEWLVCVTPDTTILIKVVAGIVFGALTTAIVALGIQAFQE